MIDIIVGALCEHRSQAHIDAHGGIKKDSLYHLSQGERPNCKPGESSDRTTQDGDNSDDPGRLPRRDNAGFHCTVWGCG